MIASKAEAEAAGGNEEVKEEIKEETEEEEHPSSTRRQVACGRREGYSHGVNAKKRLHKEKKDCMRLQNEVALLSQTFTVGDDVFLWQATIDGPEGTPYEGRCFELEMQFPSNYPFAPPRVLFVTKIFHTNVGTNGEIHLDLLDVQWCPSRTARTVLISI